MMLRKISLAIAALLPTLLFAQKTEEVKAINNMCGCFEIKFMYAETFTSDTAYKLVKQYKTGGLEWVVAEETSPNKIVMQHLLVISDSMIIKHWREDWEYQKDNLLVFDKNSTWKKKQLTPAQVKGQWTQTVWEVDDAPRYQGTASWVNSNGKYYWENTTDAPLPRREYTIRNDYNVLRRGNRLIQTDSGWTHEQDNQKIIRADGATDKLLVQEKGYNIYKKVADSKCTAATQWWNEHKAFWNEVRKGWDAALAGKPVVKLQKQVDNKSLYETLGDLQETTDKKELEKLPAIIKAFASGEVTATGTK